MKYMNYVTLVQRLVMTPKENIVLLNSLLRLAIAKKVFLCKMVNVLNQKNVSVKLAIHSLFLTMPHKDVIEILLHFVMQIMAISCNGKIKDKFHALIIQSF